MIWLRGLYLAARLERQRAAREGAGWPVGSCLTHRADGASSKLDGAFGWALGRVSWVPTSERLLKHTHMAVYYN